MLAIWTAPHHRECPERLLPHRGHVTKGNFWHRELLKHELKVTIFSGTTQIRSSATHACTYVVGKRTQMSHTDLTRLRSVVARVLSKAGFRLRVAGPAPDLRPTPRAHESSMTVAPLHPVAMTLTIQVH